jgi:DNA-binding NtrC family response regulator
MSEGPLITEVTLAASLQLDSPTLATLITTPFERPVSDSLSIGNGAPALSLGHAISVDSDRMGGTSPSPITSLDFAEDPVSSPDNGLGPGHGTIYPLSEIERITIERAIGLCNGNVVNAANALEVSPSTLYRKIKDWA